MCNGAGQAFGIYIGFVFLMILISETIWNKFRSTPAPGGLISLEGILGCFNTLYNFFKFI